MTDVVLDACTVINLINGGVFHTVLGLNDFDFHLGPMAEAEAGDACATEIATARASHLVGTLDSAGISTARFVELLAKFQLGDGETECMAFCETMGFSVATDDKKARRHAVSEFGSGRVTTTLLLLREAVRASALAAEEAHAAYVKMCSAGAFLPVTDMKWFTT